MVAITDTRVATWPEMGMHPRIPSTIYHPFDAVSCSRLKTLFEKSPAHCRYAIDHPKKPTAAMQLGSMLHMGVLEQELFDATYAFRPDFGDGRKTETKNKIAEWAEQNKGKHPIDTDNAESLRGMIAAIKAHPTANRLISEPGYSEVSFLWQDPDTGETVKARADRFTFSGKIIDIKTTSDASKGKYGFPYQAAKLLYDMQAAIYEEGIGYATGEIGLPFYFIAVESAAPFGVQVFQVNRAMMESGRRKYRDLIEQYAKCHRDNHWPAYPSEIQTLQLPDWALAGEDGEDITLGGVALY